MIQKSYAALRFIYEILCIAATAYWGFTRPYTLYRRFLFAAAAPLLIMVVWSIWGAPASPQRLIGVPRLLLELSLCLFAAACLGHTDINGLTLPFLIAGVINALINHFTGWLI